MNVQVRPNALTAERHLPFECVALVLQAGGALGAYQAGVYEALSEAGIHPDWIAGISIGAINAAIIAGNPPNSRVDRLRDFWTQVTANRTWPFSRGCKSRIRERRCRAQFSKSEERHHGARERGKQLLSLRVGCRRGFSPAG